MGKNEISKALPNLCIALGLEKCTNQQLRPTAIRNMKRGGAEDRDIIKISGHWNEKTLDHYDSTLTKDRQFHLCRLISGMSMSISKKRKAPSSSISMDIIPKPSASINMEAGEHSSMDMEIGIENSMMHMEAGPSTSTAEEPSSKRAKVTCTENSPGSLIMEEENTSIEQGIETDFDEEDDFNEILTQDPTQHDDFGRKQLLKNEQKIMLEQLKIMKEQQKMMLESLKMREKIASKKFRK